MPPTAVFVSEPVAAPAPRVSYPDRGAADAASAALVTVAGDLDIARFADLDCELRRAEEHAELVIVDLRAVDFIDSSGAPLLLGAHRRIRDAGGRMLVVRGPAVDRRFALIAIDGELELVDWPPIGPSDAAIGPDLTPPSSQ
jgi:anti-anti-sigma factor